MSETGILLILAAAEDVREGKISNVLVLLGLSIGLMYRIEEKGFAGVLLFSVDILIPVILLYIFYLLRGIGAGDIKLFSMISGLLGSRAGLEIIAFSFLLAGGVALFRIIKSRKAKGEKMPLAPFILAGYTMWAFGMKTGV